MKYLQAFALAWALCTRVPLPQLCYPRQINGQLQSLSVLFYPMVGLLLAAMLVLLGTLLPKDIGEFFPAVFIVTVWVLLTGAMHLDGLADSVDAYCASHKGSELTLAVFKDPACGPMAVVAVVLVLLLKVAALSVLLERGQWLAPLLVALVVSRGLIFPFMASMPYLRERGLAADMILKPYVKAWWIASALAWLVLLLLNVPLALCVAAAAALAFLWRRLWYKLIGGYVGDCLGALVELSEVVVLVMAVFLCF